MNSIPRLIECQTRQQLLDELTQAQARVIDLGEREVPLISRGLLDILDALEQPINVARTRRSNAIQELRNHIAEHGCL